MTPFLHPGPGEKTVSYEIYPLFTNKFVIGKLTDIFLRGRGLFLLEGFKYSENFCGEGSFGG